MHDQNLAWINTPFGSVTIKHVENQLRVELLTAVNATDHHQSSAPLVLEVYRQIRQYLQDPNYSCHLPSNVAGTEFQRRVWQAIYAIPAGETRSYGQIAAAMGSGARAVANACGANQLPLLIPCHRVVAKNGIGGFMQGAANGVVIKQWLLQHEGVLCYA